MVHQKFPLFYGVAGPLYISHDLFCIVLIIRYSFHACKLFDGLSTNLLLITFLQWIARLLIIYSFKSILIYIKIYICDLFIYIICSTSSRND